MSALRYSGELRIRVTYLERLSKHQPTNGEYQCFVRSNDRKAIVCRIILSAPAVLSHAVDSPEAFDEAARAALAFALSDGWPVEVHAASKLDGTAWHIGRSPAKAWPVEAKHDTIQSPPPDGCHACERDAHGCADTADGEACRVAHSCLPPVLDPSEASRG